MAPKEAIDTEVLAARFREKRWQIGLTYSVLVIENVFDLLYPLLIGIAINGLLVGEPMSLAPLAAIWFAHILIGAARQVYDTRLFSAIHANVAGDLAARIDHPDDDLSRVSAHISMSQNVVDFYEIDIPSIATVLIALIGAIILMFFYDVIAGWMVLGLMIPATIVNLWLGKRSLRLNRMLNNQYERQVANLASRRPAGIGLHFARLRKFKIGLSNAEAFSWSAIETFTLLVSIAVIARLAMLPDATAGSIFAGVAYLLRIIAELDRVPELIQKLARLTDIRRRLSGG
jgi:ABC-type multidrug transport system fused ATPase/permease subunit